MEPSSSPGANSKTVVGEFLVHLNRANESLMTNATLEDVESTSFSDAQVEAGDAYGYRSVSRAAVFAIVFALLGLLSWYSELLLFLPILGLGFAFVAFRNLRRYPAELIGKEVAIAAAVIAALTLIVAPTRHIYIFNTELPDGYERISFSALKSRLGGDDVPPASAYELNGKKVFLKGYIHPSSLSSSAAKTFILVPDWATCCFGTQPPLTHMIEVRLTSDQFAQKDVRRHSLAGTLQVRPFIKEVDGLKGVYYELEADHFQ